MSVDQSRFSCVLLFPRLLRPPSLFVSLFLALSRWKPSCTNEVVASAGCGRDTGRVSFFFLALVVRSPDISPFCRFLTASRQLRSIAAGPRCLVIHSSSSLCSPIILLGIVKLVQQGEETEVYWRKCIEALRRRLTKFEKLEKNVYF